MKRIFNHKYLTGLMALVMLFGVGAAVAQRPVLKKKHVVKRKVVVKPAEPLFAVDTGTVMRARMNQTLSSKTAQVGSTFIVTVTEPVYSSNGVVVVPVGSTLLGRVDSVKPAAKGGKPGEIDVSFTQLRLPNGRKRSINGSVTDLTSGGTTSDNEGSTSGKKMEHRKIIFIGGGAAGGAVLGAAIGGGKGAAIGGLLGAGAGFLGERYLKGPEAEVKSGTEFGVFLNTSISLPRFKETTMVNQ